MTTPTGGTASARKRSGDSLTDPAVPVTQSRRRDSKTSRACDSCKAKKIRCSGTLPCDICSRRQLQCSYASKYSRGRPPTPPVRGQIAGDLISRERGQDTRETDTVVSENAADTQRNTVSLVSLGGERHGTSRLAIDSLSPSPASPDLMIEGQYFDPTSGLGFLHRAWGVLLLRERQMVSYGATERERNQPLTSAGDNPFPRVNDNVPGVLCDDVAARSLVGFYFDTCIVTYRTLHRHTTEGWLESMLKDRRDGRQLSRSIGHAKCAILLTILAIATLRKSRIEDKSPTNSTASSLEESDLLFCAATNMSDSEVGFPRLESAQARLIQVLYLLQTSRMNNAWYAFGRSLQIILSLGLHRHRGRIPNTYSKECPDYILLQCGRRVFWVAYIIDKYLSVVFGRPRLLHDDEVDQVFPDRVNDEDMTVHDNSSCLAAEECHIDSLIFHAKIARLIGRISRDVYSTSTEENRDPVATANPLIEELHAWRASLPPHLGTVKPSALIPSFRREAIALQLAYSHALIHANRPFLLGDENLTSGDPRARHRIDECICAARETLELVEYMAKDANLFHSFWWTHYVTFCALAVVYVWQIRSSLDDKAPRGTCVVLDELTERCHSLLHTASSAASPTKRYGMILDEIRLEAKRQATRNTRCHPMREIANPNISGENSTTNISPTIGGSVPNDSGLIDEFGGLQNLFQSWQTTDWLDLDSSAFYPIPEAFDHPY